MLSTLPVFISFNHFINPMILLGYSHNPHFTDEKSRLWDMQWLTQDHMPGQEQSLDQPPGVLDFTSPLILGGGALVCTQFTDEETEAWRVSKVPVVRDSVVLAYGERQLGFKDTFTDLPGAVRPGPKDTGSPVRFLASASPLSVGGQTSFLLLIFSSRHTVGLFEVLLPLSSSWDLAVCSPTQVSQGSSGPLWDVMVPGGGPSCHLHKHGNRVSPSPPRTCSFPIFGLCSLLGN